MAEWKFFVPGHIESVNVRQKKGWRARSKHDKAAQKVWGAIIHSLFPSEAFVDKPHQKRQVALCVLRRHTLDYDNLVGGLKPFIDVLRCWKEPKTQVVGYKGVIFDDTPEYVNWHIGQAIVKTAAAEGIWVTVSDAPPDVPYYPEINRIRMEAELSILKTSKVRVIPGDIMEFKLWAMCDAIAKGEKPDRLVLARPDGRYEVTVKRRK